MSHIQLSDSDLRLLRVLDALLETNSVRQAAATLGVTSSAVSHSLRELRELTGDPLFVRIGAGLRPTQFALAARTKLRAAMSDLRHVLEGVPSFDPVTSRREFSIVLPDHLIPDVLGPILDEFDASYPNLRVRLWPLRPETHMSLASGELDLVLTAGHSERFLSLDRGMMRTRMQIIPFVCIVRPAHPILERTWDLAAYASLPQIFVSLSGASRSIIDDTIEAEGLARRHVLTMASDASVGEMVAATNMVATVPISLARRVAAEGLAVILDLPFSPPRTEALLWWHNRFQSDPAHKWWRGKITQSTKRALSG